MTSDRERLAKLIADTTDEDLGRFTLEIADKLLRKGVTLPPEPPALVTEEMAEEFKSGWERQHTPLVWYGRYYQLDALNALVAAAIRRAVERKTLHGAVPVVDMHGNQIDASAYSVLDLFNLPEAP